MPTTALKTPDYEAEIAAALAAAHFPTPDPAELVAAASVLAGWNGELDKAIRPTTDPSPSFLGRRADSLLWQYRTALAEVGQPGLIAARLNRWADDHEANARRHDESHADYAGMAAKRRSYGNDDQVAADLDVRANAALNCAATARKLAADHRAEAAAVLAAMSQRVAA